MNCARRMPCPWEMATASPAHRLGLGHRALPTVVGWASRLPSGRRALELATAGETPDITGETPAPLRLFQFQDLTAPLGHRHAQFLAVHGQHCFARCGPKVSAANQHPIVQLQA